MTPEEAFGAIVSEIECRDYNAMRIAQIVEDAIRQAIKEEREACAKVCEEKRDHILSLQSGKEGDPVDTNLRTVAWLGANTCAEAIRNRETQ